MKISTNKISETAKAEIVKRIPAIIHKVIPTSKRTFR